MVFSFAVAQIKMGDSSMNGDNTTISLTIIAVCAALGWISMARADDGRDDGAAISGNERRRDFPPIAQLPSRPGWPDPLITFEGKRIHNRQEWNTKRRPELKALFQHYMYGYLPAPRKVDAKVERHDPRALGGKADLKEIAISFGPPEVPAIHLLLVVPNR